MWRGGRAYFDRRHERFQGGRLAISLRTADPDVAAQRHAVLIQLMDRGDWGVLEAIREGAMHISDAQAALREGDNDRLRRMGSARPTLGPAIDRFLARTEATRSRTTWGKYRLNLNLFLDRMGEDFPLGDLTVQDAEAYLHEPKEGAAGQVWMPRTQEGHRVVLAAVWQMAMDEEAAEMERRNVRPSIRTNPWKKAETPRIRQTRTGFLSPEEWADLDRWMVGRPVRALLGCAFLAGLRVGEILHLRPEIDVILDGDEPLLRVQSRGGEHAWRPKTERSQRDVPMAAPLREILLEHARLGYAGTRYLIRAPRTDRPMSSRSAQVWAKEAYEAVGIRYGRSGDGLTLHGGRHTFASWLAQDGVSLNVIAELLGDRTKTVEDTYAHLIPNTLRTAITHIEKRAAT